MHRCAAHRATPAARATASCGVLGEAEKAKAAAQLALGQADLERAGAVSAALAKLTATYEQTIEQLRAEMRAVEADDQADVEEAVVAQSKGRRGAEVHVH